METATDSEASRNCAKSFASLSRKLIASTNRRVWFQKCGKRFVCQNSEPAAIAGVCVGRVKYAASRINLTGAALTETGFAKLIGDDFTGPHWRAKMRLSKSINGCQWKYLSREQPGC
jgi:hypothetical protein